MVFLRAGLIFILLTAATLAAPLVPPAGFRQPPAAHALAETFSCPDAPPPFTGTLDFRSKYEGSDSARATLNPQAEAAFHQQTRAIAEMEKFVSAHITAWHRSGDTREVSCLVTALNRWATAGALLGEARNHTGKSMRKWALATFSSGWLQLQFSKSHPLSAWPEQTQNITRWLGEMGDLTASEWRDLPLNKVNNHSYWAAWALMATSVATGRQDLFDQSLTIYRTALQQIDAEGFLPNELRRRQRALAYHNYALQPLVMIALFARANGVDTLKENSTALPRLATQVIAGLDNPQPFTERSGAAQDIAFLQHPANLAWLEAWCQLADCDNALRTRLANLRPLQNRRLGGPVTLLIGPKA
ncbi:mannuronate-specific alginate lyase [Kosakonia cowanii]|uniref:mannuronate-specific alginate lyase n=1 Tax=Kosakonia cowanii TaxID=208223 RepID=UPI0023F8D976|nr:mannuronate-specific alginate lyase [Kosakonia cowanii]MDF7760607.1 mannuronate-specific alginate lyase [Kosakonia cowanii]